MKELAKEITADGQVARIFEWRRGFNTIYLIDLGVHLGLFRALAESPGLTGTQLAVGLGLHPPYVEVWCKTAYGLEILDADADGGYRLGPHFDAILASPTHPRYLGGYVRLGTEIAAEDFRRCREAFKSGQVKPFQGRGDHFNQAIAESTQGLQVVTAKKILPALGGPGGETGGGGRNPGNRLRHRQFSVAGGEGLSRMRAWPVWTSTTKAWRRHAPKFKRRDWARELQFTRKKWMMPRASFDACVMIEVLHEIAPGIRPAVVAAAARTLKAGGWMVIVDETYPSTLDEARRPEFRFPLQTGFEEMIWGNVIPTREEQEKLLRDAGLQWPDQP